MKTQDLRPSERMSPIGGQLAGAFQQFQEQAQQGAEGMEWRSLGKVLARIIDLIEETEPSGGALQ